MSGSLSPASLPRTCPIRRPTTPSHDGAVAVDGCRPVRAASVQAADHPLHRVDADLAVLPGNPGLAALRGHGDLLRARRDPPAADLALDRLRPAARPGAGARHLP